MDGIGLSGIGRVWYDRPYYVIGAIINNHLYGDSVATSISLSEDNLRTPLIFQNYPNPFNNRTTFQFELESTSTIRLFVFDMKGNIVQKLVNKTMNAGIHSISWDASRLPSGIYLCELRKNNQLEVLKILLQK
jgi:hypothetical protein